MLNEMNETAVYVVLWIQILLTVGIIWCSHHKHTLEVTLLAIAILLLSLSIFVMTQSRPTIEYTCATYAYSME